MALSTLPVNPDPMPRLVPYGRKLVQISAVPASERLPYGELYGLASDGTVWLFNPGGTWHQLPSVPGCDEAPQ